MIECTGNWLRQGLIRHLHENGMGLIGIPRPEGDFQEVDDDSEHYSTSIRAGAVDTSHRHKSFIYSFNRSQYL
jgi:hypothetical protein